MASSVIKGNTVEGSPNTSIINADTFHVDNLHLGIYVIYTFPNANNIDTLDPSNSILFQAWFSSVGRTAQSRDSSLPDIFAPSLTDLVVQETTFRACTSQEGQTLFLRGGMGVGKTTTICGLIGHLRQRGDVEAAFMLLDSDREPEHDARKILMLFIQQLTDPENSEHRRHVLQLIEKHSAGQPSTDEIMDTLAAIINTSIVSNQKKRTCLLLDGLDEMVDSRSNELLSHLAKLQQLTRCGVIMTGRVNSPSLMKWFTKAKTLEVQARQDDIQYYVDTAWRGSAVRDLVGKDLGKAATIRTVVEAGSYGSFLLTVLNTSHIVTATTKKDFQKALNDVRNITSQSVAPGESVLEKALFPRAFDRNLRRLSHSQHAGDILTFVRDGMRPFRAIELHYVLALHNSADEPDQKALQSDSYFSDITQGLVTVGSGGLASFVHPGLRTYLQHGRTIPSCTLDQSDKNSALAHICIGYLSSYRFSGGPCTSKEDLTTRISGSPFLDYAVKYWHRHYLKANRNKPDMALRKSALRFLSHEGSVSSTQQLMSLSRPLRQEHEQTRTVNSGRDDDSAKDQWLSSDQTRLHTTGLHLAIQLRLDELAEILMTELSPSAINRADGNGETPLHLAIMLEADDVVRSLVRHVGGLDVLNMEGFSSLHIAAARGNLSAVRTLLCQPAERININRTVPSRDSKHQYQLQIVSAVSPRRSSAWNERDLYGATALHLAARNGHVEIVKQIVHDSRCTKFAEDNSGMTVFHKACKYGQLEVVKLLIGTDATYVRYPSSKDGRLGFHLACKYAAGYEVAKYLLETYPDICRTKDKSGEVALHHAALGGVVRTVQMLLRQPDINVNARNDAGQTPLALAAEFESAALNTLYDYDGVDRWVEVEDTTVEEIVRRLRQGSVKI